MKKFRRAIRHLRALPKLLHRRRTAGNESQGSAGARAVPGSSERQIAKHQTATGVRNDRSLEMFIAAFLEATGYRLTEQQADRLRSSMTEVDEPGKTPSPKTDARPHRALENGPAPVPSQLDGGQEAHPYGVEPGGASFPGPFPAGEGRSGIDPGFLISPYPSRDELMTGARELQREMTGQQNFGLSQADMAELLSLVHRLGQIFFEQSRDKVTHQELQAEIANLKRLIESKGK